MKLRYVILLLILILSCKPTLINNDRNCDIIELRKNNFNELFEGLIDGNVLSKDGIDYFNNYIENGIYIQLGSSDYLIVDVRDGNAIAKKKNEINFSNRNNIKLNSLLKEIYNQDFLQKCNFKSSPHSDFSLMLVKSGNILSRYFSFYNNPNDLSIKTDLKEGMLIIRHIFDVCYPYYYGNGGNG